MRLRLILQAIRLLAKLLASRNLFFYLPLWLEDETNHKRMRMRTPVSDLERRLGSQKLVVVDVGCRGGLFEEMQGYLSICKIVGYDADKAAADAMDLLLDDTRIFQTTIGVPGIRHFFRTAVGGSSSVLNPMGSGRALQSAMQGEYAWRKVQVIETSEIQTVGLETALHQLGLREIDVLKIDIQGVDVEAIKTMGVFRPFVIRMETSTVDLYLKQETMGAALRVLGEQGYMPISLPRSEGPIRNAHHFRNTYQYVGDLYAVPDFSEMGTAIVERNTDRWRVCMEMFGYGDFANHWLNTVSKVKPICKVQAENDG